jgi:muramoyltetrapeptide carboxypeptidase
MPIVAPPVRPGDTLAVITPATPFDKSLIDAGVGWLENQGFRVKVDPEAYEKTRYTSGSAELRAGVVMRALNDPEVQGVIGARGGYGSVHLLPFLDLAGFAEHPKRVVGCSDLTSLLHFILQETGVVTYHGPMVAAALGRGPSEETAKDFLATLAGEPSPARERDLEVLVAGQAEGPLSGGCISLLAASLATPYEFQSDGCVLFLEDIKEHPYKIDRMLTQLLLAGKFDNVPGIVFGQMEGCEAPADAGYRLQDVLHDLLRPLGIPLYYGFPSGHAEPNLTLPLGARVRLDHGRLHVADGSY